MSRRRKRRKLPKGGGCLIALAVALLLLVLFIWKGLYPLLARQDAAVSEVLVIEGWVEDGALGEALRWAQTNGITTIYTTGGPVPVGGMLVEWKTYAEMTRARLERMGANERYTLVAAPAPDVSRGRTHASAVALQNLTNLKRGSFTLASEGTHTRRSWRAFQQVFGDGVDVGSLALAPAGYGPADWWRCSEGVRDVIAETIAWAVDGVPGWKTETESAAPAAQ